MNNRLPIIVFLLFPVLALSAQDSNPLDIINEAGDTASEIQDILGLELGIGVQTFANPDYDPANPDQAPETLAYQSLNIKPDIAIGQFGLGLDLTINYTFTGGPTGDQFQIRAEDWVPNPDEGLTFLDIYLPKFRYIRWDEKGAPLYIMLGSIDNAVLGNGFIMGNYANTNFLPERRIFGLSFDLDGALFGFPYVGFESFIANLARFDLFGGRLFVRPLAWLEIPILPSFELGGTFVIDGQPFLYATTDPASPYFGPNPTTPVPDGAQVLVWGLDFQQPILTSDIISLSLFGDIVSQTPSIAEDAITDPTAASTGGMIGFGGRLFGIINYGGQVRILGEDFIPVYFDKTYDLFRVRKYQIYSGAVAGPDPYAGYFVTAGFNFFEEALRFNVSLAGPFDAASTDPGAAFKNPRLRGELVLEEGLLGGFSFEASYDKSNITDLADLISPVDAVIGARINYRTGPATISLVYDVTYDPFVPAGEDPWTITSGLESSISLF